MSKKRTVAVIAISVAAIIVGAVLVASCRSGSGGDPLAGTQWQVRSYYNPANVGGMSSPVGNTQLTAIWADNTVSGSSGCNTYTGQYDVKRDSLSISKVALTMMACAEPAGVMEQEQAYLAAMQSAESFKLDPDQLHLLNEKGQVVVDYVPLPAASSGGDWDKIKAAGKMVVGTSADYPPFESYVGEGMIDGFDIALINEIGRRLGVSIEYVDIAFEGLGPALQQGQIDAAIAAISRTPEREVYADFSNVYLVGEGAALATQASGISVTTIDDLARYKVAVQRNSVYQKQIQNLLIDTGKMSPDNLFAYANAEDAVNDLIAGKMELVLLDSQTAQSFVDKGGVKIAGIGVNQQYYAIAMPKGARSLAAKIDQAITDLFNDGTISKLSGQYLGEPKLLPTPTPGPTSAPVATPACVDGMVLVQTLTQDGNMAPGEAFTKGWRIKNSGSCPWTTSYKLVFASGDKMGGEPVPVAREVSPGGTYDMQLKLVAPLQPGSYEGVWQMANAQGTGFGEKLLVTTNVAAMPTSTPPPTQTPSPSISFTVDRTQVKAGECVTFQWNVQNVKEVYFYAQGEAWQDHGVAGQGSSTECPPVTTTYYLRVVYPDGTVDQPSITVNVQPAPQAPQIVRFTVDPPGQITLGQCVTIRWEVQGDVSRVTLSANGNVLWDPAPTAGNLQDCPNAAGTVSYQLKATGPGGTSNGQVNINVATPATATPAPTPVPAAPEIYSFNVSPTQIKTGECVGLSWSVGGGASYTRIARNGEVVVDDAGFKGQVMDCLAAPGNYVYLLAAQNPSGQEVTQQQSVNVTEAPAQNPLANTRWKVTTLVDPATGGRGPVIPGTNLTMEFSGGGQVNGSAGCNSYQATYVLNGSQLAITPPIASGMFCGEPAGIMEQEQAFLALLPTIASYTIDSGSLFLANGSGQQMVALTSY